MVERVVLNLVLFHVFLISGMTTASSFRTMAIIDSSLALRDQSSLRMKLTSTNRADLLAELVEGVSKQTAVHHMSASHLLFLLPGADDWITANEFLSVDQETPLPRFLRVLWKDTEARATSLSLPWRHFSHVTFAEGKSSDMTIAGHTVVMPKTSETLDVDGVPHGATGKSLWDGAILLAAFLSLNPDLVRAQTVIELGAGHGLAGLAAALLNAENVAITDLEYALPAARTTVDLNVAGLEHSNTDVQIEALDWFKPPSDSRGRWSVILASDVVWLQELVRPFVNTLDNLCDENCTILLSYQRRGKEADVELWRRITDMGFSVEGPIDFDPFAPCSPIALEVENLDDPSVTRPRAHHVDIAVYRITRTQSTPSPYISHRSDDQ